MRHRKIIEEAKRVFSDPLGFTPQKTLRAGNALDEYRPEPRFDPVIDSISDEYLEEYHWGISHLDPDSWKYYLPTLIEYSLKNLDEDSLVTNALLNSLRPPDRTPPRLASLSQEQERVIVTFLETLAFNENSAQQDLACQVMEEWWIPNALYRGSIQ
ncbi:DUF6714 family protein [Pseudomonas sp. OF001]|uniref:DUF6714 family protein n=1 Tax=Pseudomonas sp. OF001 TaxID=2772300 RepID=UPI00191B3F2E|nr:DUF6714 family protein [Pseudomonas sp. OF001]